MKRLPLAESELDDINDTAPVSWVPLPETNEILPPIEFDASDTPATEVIEPPFPESLEPTKRDIFPLRPFVLDPEIIEILPLGPSDAVPVKILIRPLVPETPELEDEITTRPLEEMWPIPLDIFIEPPVPA
jgi:hypothetical protein